MAKIEIISSCVVGSTGNCTSISRLELTSWDLPLLQTSCIQKGLIFQKPQSPQNLIHHLKTSFSRALHLFPPLAGRLSTTAHHGDMASFFVDCNNAGAEFIHAVAASVSVSHILDPTYTPHIVSSFFPLKEHMNLVGASSPLFGVQLTELADGIFIGCSANHAVLDGTSFWHFINSWSEIARGFHAISKAPAFERWFPSNYDGLVHLPTLEQNLFRPSSWPQKVFHLSRKSLHKLKGEANSEAGTGKISSLQAVLAHLWRSTTRCGWISVLMMAIGARARMGLAEGYFGNAAYVAALAIDEAELLQKGLGHTALKIKELVSKQTNEAIISSAEKKVEYMRLGGMSSRALIVGGSRLDDVYGNDFGWGSPIAVRSGNAHKFQGLVVVLPAAESGGIDLEVCLPELILEAMQDDAEFITAFATPE